MAAHSQSLLMALCAVSLAASILAQGPPPPAPGSSTLPPPQQGSTMNKEPPSNGQQQVLDAYQQLLRQGQAVPGFDLNALLQHHADAMSQYLQTGSLPCPPAPILAFVSAHLQRCAQGGGSMMPGLKPPMPVLMPNFPPSQMIPPFSFPDSFPAIKNLPNFNNGYFPKIMLQQRNRRSPKFQVGSESSILHPKHEEGPKQEHPSSPVDDPKGPIYDVKPIGA